MAFAKILVIEDDPNLGYILQESLELQGFEVVRCEDGEAGHSAFVKEKFDLCLIDVMLPKKDGFTLAKEIREIDQDIPIIILRIQAVLKRSKNSQSANQKQKRFVIGNYVFEYERQALLYKEKKQKLTHKESELLRLLCFNLNQILDREIALKQIWGDDSFFTTRSMDVYITKLRKYLRNDDRIEIMNIHGKGFKMIVK